MIWTTIAAPWQNFEKRWLSNSALFLIRLTMVFAHLGWVFTLTKISHRSQHKKHPWVLLYKRLYWVWAEIFAERLGNVWYLHSLDRSLTPQSVARESICEGLCILFPPKTFQCDIKVDACKTDLRGPSKVFAWRNAPSSVFGFWISRCRSLWDWVCMSNSFLHWLWSDQKDRTLQ